jgi:hypothetical protein
MASDGGLIGYRSVFPLQQIGGGNGSVITAVLKKYPAMLGILLPGSCSRPKGSG